MKNNENNTFQHAGLLIGIALILFLILLGGGVIMLRVIEDNNNLMIKFFNVVDKMSAEEVNYEVLPDETKVNNSSSIAEANIDKDGVIFSNFAISEAKDENDSGEENGIWSDIDFNIENTTEEDIVNKTYVVEFYDSQDNLITEVSVLVESLEAGQSMNSRQTLTTEVVNATRVDVSSVSLDAE